MLTYIEPCGWCSSSISSSYCPSNVNTCLNLSTSLISNSDSISISTDSTSSEKTQRPSTYLTRSSFSHPNDYYTSKRIDELHERMDDIQISSFLKFINHHLSLNKTNENLSINDLVKDLSNGHVLIDLIEILSSTKLKREHGRTRFHSLANVQYVLDYLKLRMQHINISPHEIVQGNRKQILALLWIIIKIFNFPDFRFKNKNCFVENTLLGFGQDRSITLKWLNHILDNCLNNQQIFIQDFSLQTWTNGHYLSLIIKYLIPLSNKYLTLKCFDYLKELNSSNNEHFQICLNLSNYCFNTITIIDYTDKTDKCLFKYFTELQQSVLNILKTNQIGKLVQNNPYTKQILQTISQTTEHSSHVINDHEQYLVCIEDEKQATLNSMDHLSRIRTVEKSRLFNDEQQKMILKRPNRWEKIDNISSNLHVINDHHQTSKEKQTDEITNQSQQLNGTAEEIEQKINEQVKPKQSIAITEDLSSVAMQMTVESQLDETLEQFVGTNKENNKEKTEQKQLLSSNEKVEIEPLEQTISTISENLELFIDEDQKLEQKVESIEEIEQATSAIAEKKQFLSSNEKIEPLEQIALTVIENKPSIHINGEEEEAPQAITAIEESSQFIVEHKTIEQHLQSQFSTTTNEENRQYAMKIVDNETTITSNGELEQPKIELKEVKQLTDENEKLDQSSIPTGKVELFIENNSSKLPSDKKPEQSPVIIVQNEPISTNGKSSEQSTVVSSTTTSKKLEKPAIIESQHRIVSNGQSNKSNTANKKSTVNIKNSVPMASSTIQENPHSTVLNEQPTRSTMVVKELEQCKLAAERTVQTAAPAPARCSRYSEIVSNQTSKANNESVQGTASFKKQEQSAVSRKKTMLNEKFKPASLTAEEIEQVPVNKESKQSEVSLEKQGQPITVIQESLSSAISNEETKKSSSKNKKSRRTNAKKVNAKNSSQQPIVNIEEEEVEPSLPIPNPTAIPQEQKPQNIQSEIQNSSPNHENPPANSSALRSRQSKKKKTIATTTTTLINKSSLSPSLPSSTTVPHRNLFVIIKESIHERKIIAFKCVVILICLCFSIIILVLSHK